MARIRSVKPELRTSLTAADWPREVRYFWVLLWGYLDDHGYGQDEPRIIKADCFPMDDDLTAGDIDKWLDIIAARLSLPLPGDSTGAAICTHRNGLTTSVRSTRLSPNSPVHRRSHPRRDIS